MSRNPFLVLLTAASLCIAAASVADEAATPASKGERDALALVFAERDLAAAAAAGLAWRVTRDAPEGAPALPSKAVLDLRPAAGGAPGERGMVELHLKGGGTDRVIGRFPAAGGDPVLVFFLETTAQDMAQLTGGSPFYIRNRIKDAFRTASNVTQAVGGARTVLLTPFADDPNAPQMGGFDGLTLSIGLAPQARAPIRSLTASAPSADYSLHLEIPA